ncbi:MAG: NAD(P)/FAD-dependent oxidoreductase [Bacillales bacterium]|jgi:predicted Rossmann fold flavoprotein|nr:NAD(P)/FAD-dependent oxidoreductase [Bacillales bacterium]
MKKVAVIGGGALGLISAHFLSTNNIDVTLFEINDKVGKKIKISGNGKGNLSNLNIDKDKYNNPDFVKEIIKEDVIGYFKSIALLTYADKEGRIYPINENAGDIVDVLINNKYKIINNVTISLKRKEEQYQITYQGHTDTFDYLILGIGSNISNNKYSDNFLKDFSFFINKRHNILGPLLIFDNIGTFRRKGKISLVQNNKVIYQEVGELQFKNNQLSGICIFNASYFYEEEKENKIIFEPFNNEVNLLNILTDTFKDNDENLIKSLSGLLPKPLLIYLFKNTPYFHKKVKDLRNDLSSIINIISTITLPIKTISNLGQVQAGGIKATLLNDNLELKDYKNFFMGGEMLDIYSISGGYNLHFAFACGLKIAKYILNNIKQ